MTLPNNAFAALDGSFGTSPIPARSEALYRPGTGPLSMLTV